MKRTEITVDVPSTDRRIYTCSERIISRMVYKGWLGDERVQRKILPRSIINLIVKLESIDGVKCVGIDGNQVEICSDPMEPIDWKAHSIDQQVIQYLRDFVYRRQRANNIFVPPRYLIGRDGTREYR